MKIVILDGYTSNPGDLSWVPFEKWGTLTVYDRTKPEQIVARSQGVPIVLVNKVVMTEEILSNLPDLKYIGLLSTGVNVIDLKAARARGIVVCNIPSYSTDSVAQWAFAHLLNLSCRVAESSLSVRNGDWSSGADFSYWKGPLIELAGKTLGIVGFGSIGRKMARLAQTLGMNVVAYGPHLVPSETVDGVLCVPLDDLFQKSDAVSLHCPLCDATRNLINRDRIAQMKDGAFLINTCRGPVLAEQDVADALNSGKLGGLGADVLSVEPPPISNPLLQAKNCYLTPHNAWASKEARTRLIAVAADNVGAFLNGHPQNRVS